MEGFVDRENPNAMGDVRAIECHVPALGEPVATAAHSARRQYLGVNIGMDYGAAIFLPPRAQLTLVLCCIMAARNLYNVPSLRCNSLSMLCSS